MLQFRAMHAQELICFDKPLKNITVLELNSEIRQTTILGVEKLATSPRVA